MTATHRDGTRPNPPLLGSLVYLLLNLPVGIASFVFLVVVVSVGLSTVIIWVGLAVLALGLLLMRAMAQLERLRVHAMLGTYVATPYRPVPEQGRWTARVKDPATWKDFTYLLLMFPLGIAEFVVVVVFWSVSLYMTLLPLYWPWVSTDWHGVVWNSDFLVVDSWFGSLPFAAVGLVLLALTVLITNGLGTVHARFARAMLGPDPSRFSKLDGLSTAGAIDWNTEWPPNAPSTARGSVS